MKLNISIILLFANLSILIAQKIRVDTVSIPVNTSIRGMQVLNDSTLWICGNKGVFAYSEDCGASWYIDSLRINSELPDYRSIEVIDRNTVIIANAGSPAAICKTMDAGRSWKVVHSDMRPEIFIDAIAFDDSLNGIALGDPINALPVILKTDNGGDNWTDVSKDFLYQIETGEAFFAASNSCMHYQDSVLSFVSGGACSNYYTCNFKTYTVTVTPLPLISGTPMQGAFTKVKSGDTLFAAGGDYDKPDTNCNRLAVSYSRGLTWQNIKTDIPFISSMCLLKRKNLLFAACMPGIYLSSNQGKTWKKVAKDNLNIIYASPTENILFAAGKNGQIIRITIE
ncbi:MAG: hypothetical protein IPO27_04540 [Bacteroidetes bacterium]|nr:hypothetical protein [Bacteroidota bacterium]